jgi:uncharacterized protein YcfL
LLWRSQAGPASMRWILLAAVLAAMVALPGCGVTTVSTGDPVATGVAFSQVRKDPGMSNEVAVVDVRKFDRGGVLMAQVTVRNQGLSKRTFRYRFEFVAADGMQVGELSSVWRQETVLAGESRTLSQPAAGRDATDFRLVLAPNR